MLKIIIRFFKKEKIDWLDEQPYLGKYFTPKIKRMIMNVVYKLWKSVADNMLQKYYAEIKFKNEEDTFEAVIPFVIMAENYKEAEQVIGQITDNLRDTYKFTILRAVVDDHLLMKETYIKKERELQDKLRACPDEKIGTITFESHIGAKTKPQIKTHLNMDGVFEEKIERKDISQINFPIIKNGKKKPLYQVDGFIAIVKLLKNN